MPDAQRPSHAPSFPSGNALILSNAEAFSLADRVLNRLGGGPPNVITFADPLPGSDAVACLIRLEAESLLTPAERAKLVPRSGRAVNVILARCMADRLPRAAHV